MKTLNKVIIKYLSLTLLLGYASIVYGERISLDDIISNQIVDLRLIDRCGDRIPSDRTALDRCRKKEGGDERVPPAASEACAYDRIGDELKISFDEVQVSDSNIETYLKVFNKNNNVIYDKKVTPKPFDVYVLTRREVPWPLTNQVGQSLQVGRKGEKYKVQLERRNQGDILYTTGVLDILVDDCRLRNATTLDLINDSSIRHNPGFDLYLKLLNSVVTKICNKIELGLLGSNDPGLFSQRCRYQCINNDFTNVLIDQAKEGLNASNDLNQIHDDVAAETSENFHFIDNARTGYVGIDVYIMLLSYITYEDHLRARGYFNCNGPLNLVDTTISIKIIEDSVEDVVVPVIGAESARFFRQIIRHLVRTEGLYDDLVRANNF